MKIQESAENYLESILMLSEKQEHVRSIDVVNDLNFSKPSVSVAMKNLKNEGYINIDGKGYITLLDKGKKIAEKTLERHRFFTEWLCLLGVNKDIASKDACRMEHVISTETFEAIKQFVNKTNK